MKIRSSLPGTTFKSIRWAKQLALFSQSELSTSYHENVDFDLDLQYPHLTPCSAISTQSTEDWYSADKNLRTLWVNEVPRVELETLGSDHRCIEKMEEQYVRCLTPAELSP